MKISVIITVMLFTQVSASFFDVFQGAVQSVQNSFGRLLSDVVTDVKETVDCTILAVERVLALSNDASARYYEKCGGANKTDSASIAQQVESFPKVEVKLEFPNNEEYLQKEIPAEIDAQINKTLSKVLGEYSSHKKLLSVENMLAQESEKLAGVGTLVKRELHKLSNEVNSDFKKVNQTASEPSVDEVLQEIKLLEKREHITKNVSEATEIHQMVDAVLGRLDSIEATEATENSKLEDILKDLETKTNNSFVGLKHQFAVLKDEEFKHLGEIKSKIEEHDKVAELSAYIYDRHKPNYSQRVQIPEHTTLAALEQISSAESITQKINLFNSTTGPEVLSNHAKSQLELTDNTITSVPILENALVTEMNHQLETYTITENNKPPTLTSSNIQNTTDFNDNMVTTLYAPYSTLSVTETTTEPYLFDYTYRASENEEISNLASSTTSTVATHSFLNATIIKSTAGGNSFMKKPFSNSEHSNITMTSSTVPEVYVADSVQMSEFTTHVAYGDSSSSSIPIISNITTPENELSVETSLAAHNEESTAIKAIELSTTNNIDINNTSATSGLASIILSTSVSEIIQPTEIASVSTSTECTHCSKTVKTAELRMTSNVNNYSIISSKTTPITLNTFEGESQPAETTMTAAIAESFTGSSTIENLTANKATGTNQLVDDLNTTIKITTLETDSTTMTTLIDNPYNIFSSSSFPTTGKIQVITTNRPVESTTISTANEEPTTLHLYTNHQLPTILNIVNGDHDTATSTQSPLLVGVYQNRTTQTVKDFTALKDVLSLAYPYSPNDSETTGIPFTLKKEHNVTILPIATDTTLKTAPPLTTTKTLYNISSNFFKPQIPYNVTGSPSWNKNPSVDRPINRSNNEWLTPSQQDKALNMFDQQNYSDRTPRNKFGLNNIPSVYESHTTPLYGMSTILTEKFHQQRFNRNQAQPRKYDASDALDSIKSLEPGLQVSSTVANKDVSDINSEAQKAKEAEQAKIVFDMLDSLSNLDTPFDKTDVNENPRSDIENETQKEKEAQKTKTVFDVMNSLSSRIESSLDKADVVPNHIDPPAIPIVKKMGPLNPQIMKNENAPIGTPFSFNGFSATPYRPLGGLTTYRPQTTFPRENNYRNAPLDYDSFFHIPQRNTEDHNRALREAQQLIANSKRSDKIINNILNHKNEYGARSIFNNQGQLNLRK